MSNKKLVLLEESCEIRKYQLPDKRIITIDITDESEIIVKTEDGQLIGSIVFSVIDNGTNSYYCYITSMFLDKINKSYLSKGIGRESLVFYNECYGYPIIASHNDGLKKEDGSHLINDGLPFVKQMRKEGIIS